MSLAPEPQHRDFLYLKKKGRTSSCKVYKLRLQGTCVSIELNRNYRRRSGYVLTQLQEAQRTLGVNAGVKDDWEFVLFFILASMAKDKAYI